jgi:RimJ/RimL family protein N-acetyltransferase
VQPELSSELVSLRPFRAEDSAWVYEACQDPEIQRWTRVPVPYGREDAEGFIMGFARDQWTTRLGVHMAVTTTISGAGVEAVGLMLADPVGRVAEAGSWISVEHRRQGYASRALGLVIAWASSELGLARIELHIDPCNAPSATVAKSLNFVSEGVLRRKAQRLGEQRDVAVFATDF